MDAFLGRLLASTLGRGGWPAGGGPEGVEVPAALGSFDMPPLTGGGPFISTPLAFDTPVGLCGPPGSLFGSGPVEPSRDGGPRLEGPVFDSMLGREACCDLDCP